MRRAQLGIEQSSDFVLIEKIARALAKIQGYTFSEDMKMPDSINPRAQTYVTMLKSGD